jgi:uncharacterized protein
VVVVGQPNSTGHGEPMCHKTSLLLLQPTPFCNLDCSYCYLPGRDQRFRMTFDTPALALKLLYEGGCLESLLDVAWHAGEPLVLPVSYYRQAFDRLESVRPPSLNIRHHFQTNGTLISNEFCRFVKEYDVAVGVSLDGPNEIHDNNRPTRGGQGTHKLVMEGIRKLQAHEIPISILAVLTRTTLEKPDILFEFFAANGIQRVSFKVEEMTGTHTNTSLDGDDVPDAVRRFFVRYCELLRSSRIQQWVREIDGRLGLLFDDDGSENKQNIPLGIVSINWKGEFSTFSPELLGVDHPRLGNLIFGNVTANKMTDIWDSERFRRVNTEIQDGVNACRRTCEYFRVCGGGAPAKKLAEHGTFASTETVSCRLGIKAITDALLEHVEHSIKPAIKQCGAPSN